MRPAAAPSQARAGVAIQVSVQLEPVPHASEGGGPWSRPWNASLLSDRASTAGEPPALPATAFAARHWERGRLARSASASRTHAAPRRAATAWAHHGSPNGRISTLNDHAERG